ncbi:unnamed protein product [Sympodiomycopsis kandeliae]
MLLERTPPRRDQQRTIPASASGTIAGDAAPFQWTPLGSVTKNNDRQTSIPSSVSRSHIPSSISKSRIARPINGSSTTSGNTSSSSLPRPTKPPTTTYAGRQGIHTDLNRDAGTTATDDSTPRAAKQPLAAKRPVNDAGQDDEFERKLMAAMAQADAGVNPFLDKRKAMMRGESQEQEQEQQVDETIVAQMSTKNENPFYDSSATSQSQSVRTDTKDAPRLSRSAGHSPRLSASGVDRPRDGDGPRLSRTTVHSPRLSGSNVDRPRDGDGPRLSRSNIHSPRLSGSEVVRSRDGEGSRLSRSSVGGPREGPRLSSSVDRSSAGRSSANRSPRSSTSAEDSRREQHSQPRTSLLRRELQGVDSRQVTRTELENIHNGAIATDDAVDVQRRPSSSRSSSGHRRSSGNSALLRIADQELDQFRRRNDDLEAQLLTLQREMDTLQTSTTRERREQERDYTQRLKEVESSSRQKRSQDLSEWEAEKKDLRKQLTSMQQQLAEYIPPQTIAPSSSKEVLQSLSEAYESQCNYYTLLQSTSHRVRSFQMEILALKREKSSLHVKYSQLESESQRYKLIASMRRDKILALRDELHSLRSQLEEAQESDENLLKAKDDISQLQSRIQEDENLIVELRTQAKEDKILIAELRKQAAKSDEKKHSAKNDEKNLISDLQSQARKDEKRIAELQKLLDAKSSSTTTSSRKRDQPLSKTSLQPRKRPAYQNLNEVSSDGDQQAIDDDEDDDDDIDDDEDSVEEEAPKKSKAQNNKSQAKAKVVPKTSVKTSTGNANKRRQQPEQEDEEKGQDQGSDEEPPENEQPAIDIDSASDEEQVQSLVTRKNVSSGRSASKSQPRKPSSSNAKPSAPGTKEKPTSKANNKTTAQPDDAVIKPSTSSTASSSSASSLVQKKKKRRLLGMQSSNPFSADSDSIMPPSSVGNEDANVDNLINPNLGVPLSLSPVKGTGAPKQSRLNFGSRMAGGVPKLF